MQNKITSNGDLLDENGHLVECGFANSLIKRYDRKAIKANKLRIKEWDYYLIYNDDFGVALTIDDNSYMGLNSITILDFKNHTEITKSPMKFMTKGKTNFPSTSEIGNVASFGKNYSFEFNNDGKERTIKVWLKNFEKNNDISVSFTLTSPPKDSMVIITPFKEDPKAFYYNQKIVGLRANGIVKFGETEILFSSDNTRAILDWGRGVWTYKNTWYWGAGCGQVNGHEVGFNIGYGFGDTSAASENMLFYDGKAHKLEDVTFNIPKNKNGKENFLSPWTFSSSDKRFEMDFTPIIDRHSNSNVLVISSNQHQVFGYFNGTMILDDGSKVVLKNFLGFAEKVVNKW
ncbi:MAG: DUF2804 domain-containing protein [Christensenellales bacterium]